MKVIQFYMLITPPSHELIDLLARALCLSDQCEWKSRRTKYWLVSVTLFDLRNLPVMEQTGVRSLWKRVLLYIFTFLMYSGWEMKCLHNLKAVCISNILAYMNRGWFHKRFRIYSLTS